MSSKEELKIYQVMDDMFLTFKLYDKLDTYSEQGLKKIVAVCNAPRLIVKQNHYIPCMATLLTQWFNPKISLQDMLIVRCHLCKTLYSVTSAYDPESNDIQLSSLAVDITRVTKDFFDYGHEYADR